jgi:antitoxin component of RelBE/YafQ-DinJ toxin-antitoxin module
MESICSVAIIISTPNIMPLVSMGNTTISISEELRKQLLKVAAELQARTGEKVDYDEVVRYLLSRVARDEQLFKQACAPVDVDVSKMREELRKGRTEDQKREEAFEAKYD